MKVILVDDEKGILDGLRVLIKRYIPACKVVGVAFNGLEGVKIIQEQKPDIVITDIRMPQADGLEMIRMLKEAGCQAKFILLSGYADFEYARRGMQLGVQFYINKPVEEEELCDCIHQVIEAIKGEQAKLQEVEDLKQEVHNRLQEISLRDIIDVGSENTAYVEELLQMASIPIKGNHFVCALLEFGNTVESLKEFALEPVFRQIDQALGQYRKVYRFRYSGAQIAVIAAHSGDIAYKKLIGSIQRLKQSLYRELKLSMTVGIGTVHKRAAGISRSFEEARYALSHKVIKGVDVVIPYPEIMSLPGTSHSISEDMVTRLEAGLDNMDEAECVNIIREIFRQMEAERGMSPVDHQLQCLNILLLSVRKMSFLQLQQNNFLGRNILSLEGISRIRTLDDLKQWMVGVIKGIITFKLANNIPKKKDIIAEIKEYVKEHYNKQISLAELSDRFFINPYYLSQLFKQKTGDTYLNFLAQIRINKSKELLEKTDLKVYEICQMVGYSDTQHFARLFEKLVGYKPSEYRKNSRKE
ncbi:response regulator [Paenibacillus silviterrae]|uniref:response regulator n=1 Tax=Paenibacillus silviterrae TaxID=3242194 RepID=UPI002542A2BB|nr:response regulator [Paenibacillus chinjuensis]